MNQNPDFDRIAQQIVQAWQRLPNGIATVAVNFFKERFRAQNWVGTNTEPWRRRRKTKKGWEWGGRKERKGRAILVDTGRLRRSIRKVSATESSVVIATDVPYAKMHNEGFRGVITQQVKAHQRKKTTFGITGRKALKTRTKITYGRVDTGDRLAVKAHQRKINMNLPRRQFIGESPYLSRQIERYATAEIMKALK